MTYKALKGFLETLTPEQLEMKALLIDYDEELVDEIDFWEITDASTYWLDVDCYGDLESTMEQIKDEMPEYTIEDFDCIPKGTVYLRYKDADQGVKTLNTKNI